MTKIIMDKEINESVTFDDFWCDPECPNLDSNSDKSNGGTANCKKLNEELEWHDYWIAACLYSEEGAD